VQFTKLGFTVKLGVFVSYFYLRPFFEKPQHMEIKEFLKSEIKNLSFKNVSENESIIKSKLLDSITVVELIVAIEDYIGKKFPQHLITEESFDTINSICETIEKIS